MQNKEKLLEVSHVRKVFPVKKQQLRAVSDVSFSISRGEILGIVGESGCGKSTLAKILVGSLPVSEGKMILKREKEISKKYPDGIPRSFKFIFAKNENRDISV